MYSSLLALVLTAGLMTGAAVPGNRLAEVNAALTPFPGDAAPDFTLTDANGFSHTLSDYTSAGNVVVLEWFDPQCPTVAKYREASNFMNDTEDAFLNDPVVWLAVDSAGPGRSGSDIDAINNFAIDNGMTVPVLLDSAGEVGRNYGVMSTPTIVVIAPDREVVYRGAPDASPVLNSRPAGTNFAKEAIIAALDNATPLITETVVHGCTVPYAAAEAY
jgi:peroxiredoxin